MNECSSRSHAIFTVNIESRLKASGEEDDGIVKVAALVCTYASLGAHCMQRNFSSYELSLESCDSVLNVN